MSCPMYTTASQTQGRPAYKQDETAIVANEQTTVRVLTQLRERAGRKIGRPRPTHLAEVR